MRIVSLLPSATETLFALGLANQLVAVTHECDYPPEAAALPIVTRSTLGLENKDSSGIEAAVSLAAAEGRSLYEVDTAAIRDLHPDLVIAQDVCRVCAVSADQVAGELDGIPMIRQHPHSLADVLADIEEVASACGIERQAAHGGLALAPGRRVQRSQKQRPCARGLSRMDRPALPCRSHWTPDLLTLAGIEDPLARAGVPSVAGKGVLDSRNVAASGIQ